VAYVRKKTRKDGSIRWYARYLGADGRYHEEGGYPSKLAAAKAAAKKEVGAGGGDWVDPAAGRMTFAEYVATRYWPSTDHLEVSTRAGYSYYLDKHFLPRFGSMPMRRITPAVIQSWVNDATAGTLSARSVVKYHTLLHRIFARAVIDRAVATNPCAHTELPKVITSGKRIITVEQFNAILTELPDRYRVMVLVAIETGLRWGELIALRPVDIDFTSHVVHVQRTIVEVARKNSPTGQRCFVKNYPKDNETRHVQIEPATCTQLRALMVERGIRDEDLLFTSTAGTMLSRNNFRTKHWRPAIQAANLEQTVTFHNLRAAHASWLLAGGADLQTVRERLGHAQIATTQQYLGTLPDAGDRALAALRKTREGT
jgi:integrase